MIRLLKTASIFWFAEPVLAVQAQLFEARYWGQNKKIIIAEKVNIDRSGAVAQGLYAINCYMGTCFGENNPEDHVRYARIDLMGYGREICCSTWHATSTRRSPVRRVSMPIMRNPKTGSSVKAVGRS